MLLNQDQNPPQRSLPFFARSVDTALRRIDEQIDWLSYFCPKNSEKLWETFRASNYAEEPAPEYRAGSSEILSLRRELNELPIHQVEHRLLEVLFLEKRRECLSQLELVELRNTPGVLAASSVVFGGGRPSLYETAELVLSTIPSDCAEEPQVGVDEFVVAARQLFDSYRHQDSSFNPQIVIEDDLESNLMVSRGQLHVAKGISVSSHRVLPLLAHEVGTHIVTHFNGQQQVIQLLRSGLAGYDELQEGLGTFSEYIAGYLPPNRMRVIAGRVVASELALKKRSLTEIFHSLRDDYGLADRDAFDTALRAKRGGGLTKDAVYLQGLVDLLSFLSAGNEWASLFVGKFALSQHSLLDELIRDEWIRPPRLLPLHFLTPDGKQRLEAARSLSVADLVQISPHENFIRSQ